MHIMDIDYEYNDNWNRQKIMYSCGLWC